MVCGIILCQLGGCAMEWFESIMKSIENVTLGDLFHKVINGKLEKINSKVFSHSEKWIKIDGSNLKLPNDIEEYILSLSICITLFQYFCENINDPKVRMLYDSDTIKISSIQVKDLIFKISSDKDIQKQSFDILLRNKYSAVKTALCSDAAFLYYYETLNDSADRDEVNVVKIKEHQIAEYFKEINFYYLDLSIKKNREEFLDNARKLLHTSSRFTAKILPAFLIELMLFYNKETEEKVLSVEDKYLTLLSRHFDEKAAKSNFVTRLCKSIRKEDLEYKQFLDSINPKYSNLVSAIFGDEGLEAANLKFLCRLIAQFEEDGNKRISKSMSYFFLNDVTDWYEPLFISDSPYIDLLEVKGWKTRLELLEFLELKKVGETIMNAYSWLSTSVGPIKCEALIYTKLNEEFIDQSEEVLLPILPHSFIEGINFLLDQLKKIYRFYSIECTSASEVEKVYDTIIEDWEKQKFSKVTKKQVLNYWKRKYCIEIDKLDLEYEIKGSTFEKLIDEVRKYIANGFSLQEIAKDLNEGILTIQPIYSLIKEYPDWRDEKIYEELHKMIAEKENDFFI